MKEGKIKKIDELVDQILERMGFYQKSKEYEVCEVWPEVVGNQIASRTKAIRVENGTLFVTFTSATVRNEILMVKEGLTRALNKRVGREVIREIIIR
ncbi:MAG: DUF721 domain-containing protein [Odoribacter sp.]|nr:DUF721 domain-containing protein [Odoribacter sp.]